MRSRKYFAAVKVKSNVHIAWTKYQPDQYVHCDMTREEAFGIYEKMTEVVFFEGADLASRFADNEYYSKRNQPVFFEDQPMKTSNNQKLLGIYGEEMVRMKEAPVTVLFQLSSDENLANKGEIVKRVGELFPGRKIVGADKASLTLDYASASGMMVYFTDEVARHEGTSTTVNLLKHEDLTAKPSGSCRIQ